MKELRRGFLPRMPKALSDVEGDANEREWERRGNGRSFTTDEHR